METITKPGIEIFEDTDPVLETPWRLILLDDQYHTYNYVVHLLGRVFGYSPEKAFAMACVVDNDGQAILMTGRRSEVELKQEMVHAFGADPLMPESQGSMSAVIEPAC